MTNRVLSFIAGLFLSTTVALSAGTLPLLAPWQLDASQSWAFNGGVSITNPAFTPSSTSTPATTGFYQSLNATGSCASNCRYNNFVINSDSVNVNGTASAFVFQEFFGGSSAHGQRTTANVRLEQTSKTGNGTFPNGGGASYTALVAATTMDDTEGGTDPSTALTSIGQAETLNVINEMKAGATGWRAAQIAEFDILSHAGSSFYEKQGLSIVQLPGDAVAGTVNDGALVITNGSGTVGWLNGIVFGGFQGYWPFQSTATAIGCPYGCGSLGSVLDFSGATINNYFLKAPGFSVDGVGNTSAKSVVSNGYMTVYSPDTSNQAKVFVYSTSASQDAKVVLGVNSVAAWSLREASGTGKFFIDDLTAGVYWAVVTSGGSSTIGETTASVMTLVGTARLTPMAIASLPACSSGNVGSIAAINNGITAPTYHQAVSSTGTGQYVVSCTYNGSSYAWVY